MSKEAHARYNKSEKGKARSRRYKRSLKGKINDNISRARRRLEVDDG